MINTLRIAEIFTSISGEVGVTIPQGSVALFIRLQGCPLECTWCDTPKTQPMDGGRGMSIPEIMSDVGTAPNIIITGGEPFAQANVYKLIDALLGRDTVKNIVIETAGIAIDYRICTKAYRKKLTLAVDAKPPSAKAKQANDFHYNYLTDNDIIKYPIANADDFYAAVIHIESILSTSSFLKIGRPVIALSAMTPETIDMCIEYAQTHEDFPICINVQLHKILNVA